MPLICKPDCDAVPVKCPQFLNEPIIQFLVPFTGKELDNGVAPCEKLGTIAPNSVGRVGQRNPLRLARVPGVLCHTAFLRCGFRVKGREWRPWLFRCAHTLGVCKVAN